MEDGKFLCLGVFLFHLCLSECLHEVSLGAKMVADRGVVLALLDEQVLVHSTSTHVAEIDSVSVHHCF